jgi:hypothetical protein
MDRIRKALDRARRERVAIAEGWSVPPAGVRQGPRLLDARAVRQAGAVIDVVPARTAKLPATEPVADVPTLRDAASVQSAAPAPAPAAAPAPAPPTATARAPGRARAPAPVREAKPMIDPEPVLRAQPTIDPSPVREMKSVIDPPPRQYTAPPPVSDFIEARPSIGALNAIQYTRTRVFAPAASVLERHRIMQPDSVAPASVAFRMLRTQVLQGMNGKGWRTLAMFSPGANDGKTTTAINLAISLASDRRHTVLLVDFDFKRPSLAARFGLSPEFGSDDALGNQAPVEDCLYHPEGFDRLVVMPARGTVGQSSEMLAGPRTRKLVAELVKRYPDRLVLFDLPPVLTSDDALSFAPLVHCGLVVAAERRTPRTHLVRTMELLHKTPIVGTVLNRASDAPAGY